ncbi:MAG: diaminopimelate epimerase [Lachnospiraceae bacterium]|uniref:Diaminopimelate epimerase n=1 Tax=Candidatus Enterocloster excrementigallinarum TaxID=2838558 RepID=A0A9D2TCY3_9FIRM|nr:diaminopimelate epimerase [Lachnospiraceae bacterium]HJC65349.1 diaminopimelate epimerase [Candidatus Enterocloster excrementigallinarum]
MKTTVEKYHGLGNDYLVFDPNCNSLHLSPENVRLLCDRNFGVGADGVLEGPIFEEEKISVRIWNPDGSLAENSGNGVRIFAKYLKDGGYVQKKNFTIHMAGGEVFVHYLNEEGSRLKVSMGKVSFWSDEVPVEGPRREIVNETMVFGRIPYPVTCLNIGNPHCVILMDEISKELVCRIGAYSEHAKQFPEKINTQIIKVLDRTHIQTEGYERGAGYTLASGTGCCAAAAAAYRLGLTDPKVIVQMPGGTLEIEIEEDGMVLMTGDVGYVGSMRLGSALSEQLRTLEK